MQRDSAGLTSQNNELKFRLQAMEQQAQLRDGIIELFICIFVPLPDCVILIYLFLRCI